MTHMDVCVMYVWCLYDVPCVYYHVQDLHCVTSPGIAISVHVPAILLLLQGMPKDRTLY